MNYDKDNKRTVLDRLTKAFVDDILSMSDAEILAEAKEDGVDPALTSVRLKGIYEKALAEAKKSRLIEAKSALEADRRSIQIDNVVHQDPTVARARLQSILDRNPETSAKLTMAARKGEGLSDADVQSMLEDMEELGLIPETGGRQDE